MNDALLMDLADCGSPEKLLTAIFRHYPDLPRQVPIEDIAREVGIFDFKQLEAKNFEGGLTANPEKTEGVILTKLGTHHRRRRFTVGHELGHFLIPSHHGTQTCSLNDMRESKRDTSYQRQEAEANRFSAGLLLPKPMFLRDLEALGSADVTHARHLSDLYDTSMEATVNRYVDLSPDICAFIFSKDGQIRYTRSSIDFPTLDVRSGDPLPNLCATQKAQISTNATKWEELSGSVWLKTDFAERSPSILEQSLVQRNGYRITLLYIDPETMEEAEEDDELEDSWAVRFKR